jgi:predicted metallopeptidase
MKIIWSDAPEIKKRVKKLIKLLKLDWMENSRIYCVRSKRSKTRAHARIWGLSKIWQKTLNTKPAYIIEVVSERFDNLDIANQDNILIHELAHIPKNFSGSLLPHIRARGKRNFRDRIDRLVKEYRRVQKHNTIT